MNVKAIEPFGMALRAYFEDGSNACGGGGVEQANAEF